jgi:hypothetical protein
MGLYVTSNGQFLKTWLLHKRIGTIYAETDVNSSRRTFETALSICTTTQPANVLPEIFRAAAMASFWVRKTLPGFFPTF